MIFHYPAVVVKIKVSGKFRINKNSLRLSYGYGYFRVSIKPKFVKVVYLTSPAIIYRWRSRTSLARVCFLNFILHRNENYFICKLVCVYVHRICEDMLGGYK